MDRKLNEIFNVEEPVCCGKRAMSAMLKDTSKPSALVLYKHYLNGLEYRLWAPLFLFETLILWEYSCFSSMKRVTWRAGFRKFSSSDPNMVLAKEVFQRALTSFIMCKQTRLLRCR